MANTTNPPKPDGQIPTPIPFSMTSTLTGFGSETDSYSDKIFDLNKPILINSFYISSTMTAGTHLYKHNVRQLLQGSFSGLTECPYALLKQYFSRRTSFKAKLIFVPVKVSDSRAIISVIVKYANGPDPNYLNTALYSNDNMEFTISKSLEPIEIDIPMYWLTETTPTIVPLGTQAVYAPDTTIFVGLKERFIPNMIQPPTFEVLVFLQLYEVKADGFMSNTIQNPEPGENWLFVN